jgi:hypothetical protein
VDELLGTLLEIERKFWQGGAEFFRQNILQETLMVFPDPVGVLDAEASIEATANAPRWSEVSFEEPRLIRMGDTVAIIVYKALALRAGATDPYTPLASSVYVRAGEGWILGFHQQTVPFRS